MVRVTISKEFAFIEFFLFEILNVFWQEYNALF